MKKSNFFIVIEGIDGSGKTEISHRLALVLKVNNHNNIRLTFEPHDPSCAGMFIRQVLMNKIRNVPNRTLALAFAANRLDHYTREIKPYLSEGTGKILICDRYYLSSLVYQSDNEHSIKQIMEFNDKTGKPDLTLFLDASNSKCLERMKRRAQDKELFEKNLNLIRGKYSEAINFLRKRGDNVKIIDANGEIEEVIEKILIAINEDLPDWIDFQPVLSQDLLPKVFSFDSENNLKLSNVIDEIVNLNNIDPIISLDLFEHILDDIKLQINNKISSFSYNDLGALFLDFISFFGFSIGDRYPWSDLDAYEIEFLLPLGVKQIGVALLLGENQRFDIVAKKTHNLTKRSDFMFVFAPSLSELQSNNYDRDIISYQDGTQSLSPTTHVITTSDFCNLVYYEVLKNIYESNRSTFSVSSDLFEIINNQFENSRIK